MFHWFKRHTKDGLEVPDSTPHEITLREDFKRPLTIQEQIMRFTQAADFQKAVNARGLDTLEEADDLEVEDETDHLFGRTPYETRDDVLDGVQTHLDEIKGQQVQDLPEERLEKARERLKAKPAPAGAGVAGDVPVAGAKEGANKALQQSNT